MPDQVSNLVHGIVDIVLLLQHLVIIVGGLQGLGAGVFDLRAAVASVVFDPSIKALNCADGHHPKQYADAAHAPLKHHFVLISRARPVPANLGKRCACKLFSFFLEEDHISLL